MGNAIYANSVYSSEGSEILSEKFSKDKHKSKQIRNEKSIHNMEYINDKKYKQDEYILNVSNKENKNVQDMNYEKINSGMKLKCDMNKTNLYYLSKKKRVKRFNPSTCLLRNCIYYVNCKINDKYFPILLELKNNPKCAIYLIDESCNVIKEILIKDIKTIESSINSIDIFLKINPEYSIQQKFNLIRFILKDNNDKISFIDNIKMMYGIDILEYGTVKYNKISTQEYEEIYVYEKNILNKENNQNLKHIMDNVSYNEYYNMSNLITKNVDTDETKINQIIKNVIQLGNKYNPIIILGDMEEGNIIRVKEINALTDQTHNSNSSKDKQISFKQNYNSYDDFTLVEWYLSTKIGSNKKFRKEPIYCSNKLLLKSFMIGYFIKVKLSKNIFIKNKKTFVTSISIKGPVTINDNTAKHILHYLSNVNHSIQIFLSSDDIYNIFFSSIDPKINVLGLFIFYPCNLFLMRSGIRFAITLNGKSFSVDYLWNSFYMTKKDILFDKSSDFIPSYEDMQDIHLYFITSSTNGEPLKSIIRTNSTDEKNYIYSAVFFYKHQKKIRSLNEFLRDSLSGSYNNIKKRFSNIFMEINANDINKIESVN
ncbi:hypothetical protein PGSY75_1415100 [Plasmodium gaboni]|uniref:Uncharacterized protein n=1 Tax=Plasmodium gaboni TaxID=647221 RepID=A0A151L9Y5_9APIC|nr:hypothetical protein PGSY75_1415100 [Plasmodium gaboni]KYN95762.1 hypothetical protein PGSY75_1415100 [Plasmodium gaboni]